MVNDKHITRNLGKSFLIRVCKDKSEFKKQEEKHLSSEKPLHDIMSRTNSFEI